MIVAGVGISSQFPVQASVWGTFGKGSGGRVRRPVAPSDEIVAHRPELGWAVVRSLGNGSWTSWARPLLAPWLLKLPEVVEQRNLVARLMRVRPEVIEGGFRTLFGKRFSVANALYGIAQVPEIFINFQVHRARDFAYLAASKEVMEEERPGLWHELTMIMVEINLAKGWTVGDLVNQHVNDMFAKIQDKEGEAGLDACRLDIGRRYLDIYEARLFMYREFVGKGYELPAGVAEWVRRQPTLDDLQRHLEELTQDQETHAVRLQAAAERMRRAGVEGLEVVSQMGGEEVRHSWLEGVLRYGGGLRRFAYDPFIGRVEAPRNILWKDELVHAAPAYGRGRRNDRLTLEWLPIPIPPRG